MDQAKDFYEDSLKLYDLLMDRKDSDYDYVTQFKGWTINDVVGHLHVFNIGAMTTLNGSNAFDVFAAPILSGLQKGLSLVETQWPLLNGLSGRHLLNEWWCGVEDLANEYSRANPKMRVKWMGPEMSSRLCLTARQMETWAHGQEVFDRFGVVRKESDTIKNIVHLGNTTFFWTFANRNLQIPEKAPHLILQSPSEKIWKWNESFNDELIFGKAVEFAQVVTQVRNFEDTNLTINGTIATEWMKYAQCFAGPAEDPPGKGLRYLEKKDQTTN